MEASATSVHGVFSTNLVPQLGFFVLLALFLLPLIFYTSIAIRNIYFHPLSKYPGPKIAAASSLYYCRLLYNGTAPYEALKLHNKYGPVVRIGCNSLSYIGPVAGREIYGHKTQGQSELSKDKNYHAGFGAEYNILNADSQHHSVLRKLLTHGFSDKALREQEVVIQEYTDTLMTRLHEKSQDGHVALDIKVWYNFFTFDIIGYLTYGESFDCLRSSKMHTWVNLFFNVVRHTAFHQITGRLPKFLQYPYSRWFMPKAILEDFMLERKLSKLKLDYRLQNPARIPDFMEKLVNAYQLNKMTYNQLHINSNILVGAGSETTSTWLTGFTYFLLKNPRALEKLSQEIRGKFLSANEITMIGVNSCPYFLGCLEESLRMFPPSPSIRARYTPPGGMLIEGQYVPEGVEVGIASYAACRSASNFRDPEEFIPERWTGEDRSGRYDNDKKDAMQPFSLGPRNCIGRNLAYVETKLVIAKLLWHFDLVYAADSTENWLDQKIYMVWEKPPLMVKLVPVQRT